MSESSHQDWERVDYQQSTFKFEEEQNFSCRYFHARHLILLGSTRHACVPGHFESSIACEARCQQLNGGSRTNVFHATRQIGQPWSCHATSIFETFLLDVDQGIWKTPEHSGSASGNRQSLPVKWSYYQQLEYQFLVNMAMTTMRGRNRGIRERGVLDWM